MYDSFKEEGSPVSWISIAGATHKIIPYFEKSGVNLATIDYVVPLSEAFELGGNIVLNGNLKPYSFVSDTPYEIKEKVKNCLNEAEGKRNYIVGSGCEIPLEASIENVRAIVEAVREFDQCR